MNWVVITYYMVVTSAIWGAIQTNWWQTGGKLVANWWQTGGKLVANWWQTGDKLVANWWQTCGKLVANRALLFSRVFEADFTGPWNRKWCISRAFHGLIIKFHGHFTGYFLNFTTFSRGFHRNKHKQGSSRTLESQALSDTGLRPTIPGQYC